MIVVIRGAEVAFEIPYRTGEPRGQMRGIGNSIPGDVVFGKLRLVSASIEYHITSALFDSVKELELPYVVVSVVSIHLSHPSHCGGPPYGEAGGQCLALVVLKCRREKGTTQIITDKPIETTNGRRISATDTYGRGERSPGRPTYRP